MRESMSAQVLPLLDEVRRCEPHLLQQGFVEDVESMLAAVPTSPGLLERQEDTPKSLETLEKLFTQSASPTCASCALCLLDSPRPEEAQARWSTWARAVLRELPGADALRVLQHVAPPLVTPGTVRVFVEATGEALARDPSKQRGHNMTRWRGASSSIRTSVWSCCPSSARGSRS